MRGTGHGETHPATPRHSARKTDNIVPMGGVRPHALGKIPCFSTENAQKMEYGESTECLYLSSVVPIRLCTKYHRKQVQQTFRYYPEYGLSGQIVDQKCSLLFLCFFLAVQHGMAEGRTSPSTNRQENVQGSKHGRVSWSWSWSWSWSKGRVCLRDGGQTSRQQQRHHVTHTNWVRKLLGSQAAL